MTDLLPRPRTEPRPTEPPGTDDFASLVSAHRHELLAHCYRMTGSLADAEELTQETFLRAWRGLDRFRGGSSPRTWLYRIATNACLDHLKSHERRARPSDTITDTLEREAWIDPFPDRHDPAAIVTRSETTSLYLTAALLHLPPRQRAVVVARDLLDLDGTQTAAILGCTTTAVNSLLQRAHARLRALGTDMHEMPSTDADDGAIVRAYIDAHNRGDVAAVVALLSTDVRVSMPPEAPCHGRQDVARLFAQLLGDDGPGSWLLVPTRANGAPAVANYVRPSGSPDYRALSIDVLHVLDGRISAVHCFLGASIFPAFGLDVSRPGTT